MVLITVFDEVAQTWTPPHCALNSKSAIRDFSTVAKDEKTQIGQHPQDFSLYEIGEWIVPSDESKLPSLTVREQFKLLCRASQFMEA